MEKTINNNNNSTSKTLVLLRKGWSIRRLWILSIIGASGLGLDAAFHTLDTGTPISIIFDGADWIDGKGFVSDQPYYVLALSWAGHLTFLTAFSMLIVLPRLFFHKGFEKKDGSSGRRWALFRSGRTVKQLWLIALIGVAGMALDVSFHWLQDGDPSKVVLNGFDNPNPVISAMALAAHTMFLGAFGMLIFLPKILFAGEPKAYNLSQTIS